MPPMPIVKFTSNLKRFYPDLSETVVPSKNILQLIGHIDEMHQGIRTYILDDQNALRKHVNIFINNSMIQDRVNLSDEISEYDEVYIMQALSGG
jgi:molybdopterin converting factor small subunit